MATWTSLGSLDADLADVLDNSPIHVERSTKPPGRYDRYKVVGSRRVRLVVLASGEVQRHVSNDGVLWREEYPT